MHLISTLILFLSLILGYFCIQLTVYLTCCVLWVHHENETAHRIAEYAETELFYFRALGFSKLTPYAQLVQEEEDVEEPTPVKIEPENYKEPW